MATLKRCHTPMPRSAPVEQVVWERSRSGTPRRRRSNRPALTHDPGWGWDGARISFTENTRVPDGEEHCELQLGEDEDSSLLSGQTYATFSFLDIARYQVPQKCGRNATNSSIYRGNFSHGHRTAARSSTDDFEVKRIPKSGSVSEEEPGWKLDEWEKLDAWSFKRTYSEVVRGLVDGNDPLMTFPRLVTGDTTEDDDWECI